MSDTFLTSKTDAELVDWANSTNRCIGAAIETDDDGWLKHQERELFRIQREMESRGLDAMFHCWGIGK